MVSHSQHTGKQPAATARVVGTERWGRAPAPPRSVLVAFAQAILLTAGGVAMGSSPDRRRSALFCRRAVWRVISSRVENSSHIGAVPDTVPSVADTPVHQLGDRSRPPDAQLRHFFAPQSTDLFFDMVVLV